MRRRLIAAITSVATAAVVLFAIPLGVVLERSYRDEALLRLERDAVAATRAIDVSTLGSDPVELPSTNDVLAVYDRTGRRIAGRGPRVAESIVHDALRTGKPIDRGGDGRLLAAVPLLRRERIVGALRAARSDAAVAHDARRTWLALAGLAAVLVALAAVAAALLGRRLARPLERLAAAARRLGEGDFATRAPRGGVPEANQIAGALDDTAERLGELVARERSFSADASHQLRTPLAALRLELEAIELRGAPPPELPKALRQVDRLQTTIDTLLAVARDGHPRDGRTDVGALLDEIQERWRGPLAIEARPLEIRSRSEHATAQASFPVVAEILDVLLDNANRHGRGPVTVTTRDSDGWIAIDVTDHGPGFIEPVERAFARRTDATGRHGIGLDLARALAHAEAGKLTVTQAAPPVVTLWLRATA
jgi:signal transduction histidine kinase